MSSYRLNLRIILSLTVFAAAIAALSPQARAGGPLLLGTNGQPVKWANGPVVNPNNPILRTVDGQGRVLYRVDSGNLGPMLNAEATAYVDRIFGLYTGISTASIEFVNAGRILDPQTGQPVDVNDSNFGRFAGSNPTFQNPIIFDDDGEITGGGGVLGFFGFLQLDEDSNEIMEGVIVLNGRSLTQGVISETSFLGVFTHEFGHFAGPLDHAQINGNIANNGDGATLPTGFSNVDAFDLFAPFTETMYPFVFSSPEGSRFNNSFEDSGFFIASLDLDTKNALSNLYPTQEYINSRGAISGRVVLRSGSTDIPINGVNVIARRIDQSGSYPPALGTVAYTTSITTDPDGVPMEPNLQPITDSLVTVSSAVTGLEFGPGNYRIGGLPPGQYIVEIQQINPNALDGSSIGPLFNQFPLPAEEFYNGPDESGLPTDINSVFTPVVVAAGQNTSGIDIVFNGLSPVAPALLGESEPNDITKKAQKVEGLPVELTGSASTSDGSKLKVTLSSTVSDKIEDLYRISVPNGGRFYIILEPVTGNGDLDLYLFTSTVSKKKSSLSDPNLLDLSAGRDANELIAASLSAGNYLIGVTAFPGSPAVNYRLRIIPATQ